MSLAGVAMLSLTACSGDDAESTNNNNNNNNPSFDSDLYLDGQLYVPGNNPGSVATYFETGIDNGVHDMRTFHLMKAGNDIGSSSSIQFIVAFPTGENIDGTYDFIGDSWELNEPYAQLAVMQGLEMYTAMEGSLTVTELGVNEYKIEINDELVLTTPMDPMSTVTLSGSFEGEFVDADEFD